MTLSIASWTREGNALHPYALTVTQLTYSRSSCPTQEDRSDSGASAYAEEPVKDGFSLCNQKKNPAPIDGTGFFMSITIVPSVP